MMKVGVRDYKQWVVFNVIQLTTQKLMSIVMSFE